MKTKIFLNFLLTCLFLTTVYSQKNTTITSSPADLNYAETAISEFPGAEEDGIQLAEVVSAKKSSCKATVYSTTVINIWRNMPSYDKYGNLISARMRTNVREYMNELNRRKKVDEDVAGNSKTK